MSKPIIAYGFDPLCGWCYAFLDTVQALRDALGESVSWEVACGGLVVGDRVQPIGTMRDYLIAGEQQLRAAAGVQFGAGFRRLLNDGSWVSRSEPPCRAILLAQEIAGADAAIELGEALVRGFYQDGLGPDAESTIATVAAAAGLDADLLLERWRLGAEATDTQMHEARQAGVDSYPSLFLRSGNRLLPIHKGFARLADLRPLIDQALAASA